MKKPIVRYGTSILRQQALDITPEEDYVSLINDLFESLNTEEGIGLAAPQLGVDKRAFVIAIPTEKDSQGKQKFVKKGYINPVIKEMSEKKNDYNEGCLSIPGLYEDVTRPETITVSYYDIQFNLVEEQLDGIVARVFQHEYDHLNGVLFIDYLSPLRRRLLNSKLNKIKRDLKKQR